PPRKEIEQAVHRVRDTLTARNRIVRFETPDERQARIAHADAEYPKAAAALSQTLLGHVAGQLEKKRLLIVADGALQYLSFAALPMPVMERLGDGVTGRRGDEETARKEDPRLVAQSPSRPVAPSPRRPVAPSPRRPVAFIPLIVNHEIVYLP